MKRALIALFAITGLAAILMYGAFQAHTSKPDPAQAPAAAASPAAGLSTTPAESSTLLDGYNIGMNIDDFKRSYSTRVTTPPTCEPLKLSVPCDDCFVCHGGMTVASVAVTAEFSFANGKLFSVAGNFDPHAFDAIKQAFITKFGQPESDSVCNRDDPQMTPKELEEIGRSVGCEGLFWSKKSIVVVLGQVPMATGQRFSILPSPSRPGS